MIAGAIWREKLDVRCRIGGVVGAPVGGWGVGGGAGDDPPLAVEGGVIIREWVFLTPFG